MPVRGVTERPPGRLYRLRCHGGRPPSRPGVCGNAASSLENSLLKLRNRRRGPLMPRGQERTAAEVIAAAAEPFDHYTRADLEPLVARIGDARVILLGEASHGTAEFYEMRGRITLELLARAGVRIVAVEADWPDARQIDRFIRGAYPDPHPERAFTRFPTWMWANRQVLDFVHELRAWNRRQSDASEQVGFYGLDLYSMYTSIRAILASLDDVDQQAAAVTRARYGCLTPWENGAAAYGAAALRGSFDGCAADVVRMLEELLQRQFEYEPQDGDRFFYATRNATLIKNAEQYYRAMYYGSRQSWNLRDTHMFETLQALLRHYGSDARAVVWAHNSHLGNAVATAMSTRGETNLGELCRDAYGDACSAVGFGTDPGTVAAADEWGAPMYVMQVRPALQASYEYLCHQTETPYFLLPLRERAAMRKLRHVLLPERLERAIGVIYRPQTERVSHYFHASLPRQFDE